MLSAAKHLRLLLTVLPNPKSSSVPIAGDKPAWAIQPRLRRCLPERSAAKRRICGCLWEFAPVETSPSPTTHPQHRFATQAHPLRHCHSERVRMILEILHSNDRIRTHFCCVGTVQENCANSSQFRFLRTSPGMRTCCFFVVANTRRDPSVKAVCLVRVHRSEAESLYR